MVLIFVLVLVPAPTKAPVSDLASNLAPAFTMALIQATASTLPQFGDSPGF